eukprot:765365-Hanusia_phi.AAC.1
MEDLKYKLAAMKLDSNGSNNRLYDSIKKEFIKANPNQLAQKNVFESLGGGIDDHQKNVNIILDAMVDNMMKNLDGKNKFREEVATNLNKLIDAKPNQEGGEGSYFVPNDKYKSKTIEEIHNLDNNLKYNQYFFDSNVTNFDILMFVIVTYALQQITMLFIKWAINVEYIRTFESAIALYVIIYFILFFLIIGLAHCSPGFYHLAHRNHSVNAKR